MRARPVSGLAPPAVRRFLPPTSLLYHTKTVLSSAREYAPRLDKRCGTIEVASMPRRKTGKEGGREPSLWHPYTMVPASRARRYFSTLPPYNMVKGAYSPTL